MSAPLVTIGITCFREGDWLRECWESVLAQTDERWTAVIILDGGSDLRTRAVFDAIEHPRLRKLAKDENVGPYPARNEAFRMTETPYHLYLDGDDLLPPSCVADVLSTFARYPEASFVYGDYELFGGRNEIQRWRREVTWDDFVLSQPTPGACAYKKALWEAVGGYAPELARGNADYDLLIAAAESGNQGRHAGSVLYRQRVGHGARVSGSYEQRYYTTHEIMVRRHPRFFADETRRRRFLAVGYQRSVVAELAAGHPLRAAAIAARAVRSGVWRERELWRGHVVAGARGLVRLGREAWRRSRRPTP